MKSFVAIILALVLVVGLSACVVEPPLDTDEMVGE